MTIDESHRIQVLRGIAIIAVVMIHTYPHNLLGVYLRAVINFAVSMFIFLSGYLTKLEYRDWKAFYSKRLKKVVIPYLVWSTVITVLKGNYKNFFFNLMTGNCLTQYYFIIVYIQFVLVTPLIARLLRSKISWGGYFIQPISLILLNYLGLNEKIPLSLFTSWFSAYYFGFSIGNGFISINRNNSKAKMFWILALALNIAEGLIWYRNGNYVMATTQERLSNMVYSLASMVIATGYVCNGKQLNQIEKWLSIVGDCSFGIYLVHTLVINVIEVVPLVKLTPFPINSFLAVMLATAGILMCKKILGKKVCGYLGF